MANWAIFAEGNKSEWHYGELDEQFIESTVGFLNGLDGMGKELFGSGVASIELDVGTKEVFLGTREIFVVSLFSQFFLIASDPLTTIKLIEAGGIPNEVEDIMRGVLVGQASVLYSNLYTESETSEEQKRVDKMFRSTISELGITDPEELDSIVDQGRCSFARFGFGEMLTFHYLLRKIFSSHYAEVREWAIVADDSGSPIHLSFGHMEQTTSLAGYLSVLLTFCQGLFDAPPKALVFGGDSLVPLEMVNGASTFCAFASWDRLFSNPEFNKSLAEIPPEPQQDLNAPLSRFMADKLGQILSGELRQWELSNLTKIYCSLPEYIRRLRDSSEEET